MGDTAIARVLFGCRLYNVGWATLTAIRRTALRDLGSAARQSVVA